MAEYTNSETLDGPFGAENPLDPLVEFYRTNGYLIEEWSENPSDAADSDDAESSEASDTSEASDDDARSPAISSGEVRLSRGEPNAGWWSSDMTDLSAEVHATYESGTLEIDCTVDVTGQKLSEDDRAFWQRELDAATEYVRHPHRTPRDLRHEEEKRAEKLRRRALSYGIWGAVVAFVLVVLINFLFLV